MPDRRPVVFRPVNGRPPGGWKRHWVGASFHAIPLHIESILSFEPSHSHGTRLYYLPHRHAIFNIFVRFFDALRHTHIRSMLPPYFPLSA